MYSENDPQRDRLDLLQRTRFSDILGMSSLKGTNPSSSLWNAHHELDNDEEDMDLDHWGHNGNPLLRHLFADERPVLTFLNDGSNENSENEIDEEDEDDSSLMDMQGQEPTYTPSLGSDQTLGSSESDSPETAATPNKGKNRETAVDPGKQREVWNMLGSLLSSRTGLSAGQARRSLLDFPSYRLPSSSFSFDGVDQGVMGSGGDHLGLTNFAATDDDDDVPKLEQSSMTYIDSGLDLPTWRTKMPNATRLTTFFEPEFIEGSSKLTLDDLRRQNRWY